MNTNSSLRALRDDTSAQAQFIEPTRASRVKVIALLVGVGIAVWAIDRWVFPAYFGYITRLPKCDSLPWLRATVIGMSLFPLVLAATWAVPTARKVLREGQWPISGTWVFSRTPIKRGPAVRWRAYALLAWSLLAAAIPFWGLYLMAPTPIFMSQAKCIQDSLRAQKPTTAQNGHAPMTRP